MCIGFIKKLLGIEIASEEHQVEVMGDEMHEYQKTSNPGKKDDVLTDESSSDAEIDFDEEGIFQQEKKYYLSGNDIQEIIDDDDQEVDNEVQYLQEDIGASKTTGNKSNISSVKTETSAKIEYKPKEKQVVKEDSFKKKAHDKFQSKGKKMLDKRKLKAKKVEKTEVK